MNRFNRTRLWDIAAARVRAHAIMWAWRGRMHGRPVPIYYHGQGML